MNRKHPTALLRLGKLVRGGYLTKQGVFSRKRIHAVYGLTEKGMELVKQNYRFEITNAIYKSDSANHDVGLVDLREKIEKAKMLIGFFPENVLQACGNLVESEEFSHFSRLNSDAVLVLNTPTGKYKVALEFEASLKRNSRYAQKITDYYLAPEIASVFYVCSDNEIASAIRRIDYEVGEKFEPKVYICGQKIIQEGGFPIPFYNRKNGKFILT